MSRRVSAPPRPMAPGDVVTAFSDALGEWTAAQVTDLDPSWGTAGVLDLAWSGPEPSSVGDLGDPAPLVLTHHAWTGRPSHRNYDWLLPRGCTVIGNVPALVERKSDTYAAGWHLGDQLALQRSWDRGERTSTHRGERSFTGAEVASLVATGAVFPDVWKVSITEIDSLDCGGLVTVLPNVTRLSLSGDLGTLVNASSLNGLTGLRSLLVSKLFGMVASDLLVPESAPGLEMLALHSIPAEYAAAMRKVWTPEIPHGTRVDVTGARKPEWVAENRDNPLRDWDGRGHISAVRFRKAVAQYKATRRAVLDALDDAEGAVDTARLTALGREYGEAFNRLDGSRSPFIETEEREDLFRALEAIVDQAEAISGTPLPGAREHLLAGLDSIREW
ncbi:hypothetical protein OEB99_00280 [Actinotalea sp. M2MS4P-6]|uniref:hypothetical protein n=1 Tax=Actinotalea sp. M2MS4P-6 TaxID=2983762 RepID=UPI0021E471DA|nr:hypothetical protein [Actinotalea sp. M2MS4P-6]MCV2392734.1 hypothetical protein [Actinotalea sp. M2MS4P-6]